MRRTRDLILLPLIVAVAAVIWFVVAAGAETRRAEERVRHEDAALDAVRRIAAAQARHHAAEGRYGWLEDLRRDPALADLAFVSEGTELVVRTPGYRVDVLLPATSSAAQAVTLAPRGEGRLSDRLARRHMAVVARPWDAEASAWRLWYLDERGRIYVNEGVSDPLTRERPPLPTLRVPDPGGVDATGMRFWPLDDLPPR